MMYELNANYELYEEVSIEEVIATLKRSAYKEDTYYSIPAYEEEIESFYWQGDEWIVTCIDNWDYYLYRVVTDEEMERDKRELRLEKEDLIRGLL